MPDTSQSRQKMASTLLLTRKNPTTLKKSFLNSADFFMLFSLNFLVNILFEKYLSIFHHDGTNEIYKSCQFVCGARRFFYQDEYHQIFGRKNIVIKGGL